MSEYVIDRIEKFIRYVGEELAKDKNVKGYFVVAPGRSGRLLGMLVAQEIKKRGFKMPKHFLLSLPYSVRMMTMFPKWFVEEALRRMDPHYKKVLSQLAKEGYVPVYVDARESFGETRKYYTEVLRKLGFQTIKHFIFNLWEREHFNTAKAAHELDDSRSLFKLFEKTLGGFYVRKRKKGVLRR